MWKRRPYLVLIRDFSNIVSFLSIDPQSGRTYTVFAPTDLAFSNHTQEETNFMVTDKAAAHKLVMRHVTPGTLFSTGMRFYQVRDSLQAGNAITLQKVNNGNKNEFSCPWYWFLLIIKFNCDLIIIIMIIKTLFYR